MTIYTFLPRLLNMSLTAGVVILAVLVLRIFLKRAPKVISYALWGIVLFRLLCPVSIESAISLFGFFDTPTAESGELTRIEYVSNSIVYGNYPEIVLPPAGEVIPDSSITDPPQPNVPTEKSANAPIAVATHLWMAGVISMAGYAVLSLVKLKRKLITASPLQDNIYLADGIPSPFVMGVVRPKIYLPSSMDESERPYIIMHERHHIKRLDHIIKAVSFGALCIHWFNPLVWVAFITAGKDMEMSCDEAVVRKMGDGILADYTASLLNLATGKRIISGMPLAFGEGDTKGRIRNLVNLRKPAFWVVVLSVIACVVLSGCLLTNPSSKTDDPQGDPQGSPPPVASGQYNVDKVVYTDPDLLIYSIAKPAPTYRISEDMTLSSLGERDVNDKWVTLGRLTETKLTEENFDKLFHADSGVYWEEGHSAKSLREHCAKATMLVYKNTTFYYVLRQDNGEIYLVFGYYDYYEKDEPDSDDTLIHKIYKLSESVSYVTKWVDLYRSEDLYSDKFKETTVSQFPDTVFRWTQEKVEAVKDGETTVLYSGMPVWNVYFCDLTGDGLPELCSTVSFGSGMVDDRIIVYDYAKGETYELADRGFHDYTLSVLNGRLTATMRVYISSETVQYGYLVIAGEKLQIVSVGNDLSDLVLGTTYVSYQCIYQDSASSYLGLGGDSGYTYTATDGYFETVSRQTGAQNLTEVKSWEWQPFPYTESEWAELHYTANGVIDIGIADGDVMYIPLTAGKFLMRVRGDIWIAELRSNANEGTRLHSIYSLVPEATMGESVWTYEPYYSSYSPLMNIRFNIDCTEIEAVCDDGEFVRDKTHYTVITIPVGEMLGWSPATDEYMTASSAAIYFTVKNGDGVPYHGTLYIEAIDKSADGSIPYRITLVGTGLHLSQPDLDQQGNQYGCCIISLVDSITAK